MPQRRRPTSGPERTSGARPAPQAVALLYDPDEKIIGLQGADPQAEGAYPIRHTSAKAETTFLTSGLAFTKYWGIDTETSRRRKVYVEDGILCIDLNDPGTEIVGNRSRNTASADLSVHVGRADDGTVRIVEG